MTTRRITDSSIGAGGGGAVVRFQDDEPTAIRPGELWVESDGTSSLINANDYLTKVDASAGYAPKTQYIPDAPANPSTGQLWVDSDTNLLYFYDGSDWILAGGAGGGSKAFSLFTSGM